jgi:phosphatidylinositol alpha 1,6-mannosyltransferase
MTEVPRVALFCETYHEINGVALTARQLVAYAKRQGFPLLAIHGGKTPGEFEEEGIRRIELKRGWASMGIESDLEYDFLFVPKYRQYVRDELEKFKPDVIHITSPGEFGILGVHLSKRMKIPLVASWHTNFHQFLARRMQKAFAFAPSGIRNPFVAWTQEKALRAIVWFYGYSKVTLAPTMEQVEWLRKTLQRPSFLMPRGVDAELFHPGKRTVQDQIVRIGFVGRVTPEKGVRLFAKIETAMEAAGISNFRIVLVGQGSEVEWLKTNLKHGDFAGVLRGEALAQAYANMDVFAFPSRTDTFGNVIQEAAASKVPSVVTNEGGPQHLVVPGKTGYVAKDNEEFVARVVELAREAALRKEMGRAARERMVGVSWDAAFEKTYAAYRACLPVASGDCPVKKQVATAS